MMRSTKNISISSFICMSCILKQVCNSLGQFVMSISMGNFNKGQFNEVINVHYSGPFITRCNSSSHGNIQQSSNCFVLLYFKLFKLQALSIGPQAAIP